MPRETVTLRHLDLEGNLLRESTAELMVRRPRTKPAYAVLPGNTPRHLVADHPAVVELMPPRPVQQVNLRDVLTQVGEQAATAGATVRIIYGAGDQQS